MKRFLLFISTFLFFNPLPAKQVPLQPEQLFPESAYRNVYGCCTSLWYQLRSDKKQAKGWHTFNDQFIDGLIVLDRRIQSLTSEPQGYSPDDIEHLAGVLNHIHLDYAYSTEDAQSGHDMGAHAAHYFFTRIKRKLEQLLPN